MRTSTWASRWRLVALFAVLAMVAAACNGDTVETTPGDETTPPETTPVTEPPDTGDTTPDTGDTTPDTSDTTAPPDGEGEAFNYTMGIFADITTDNLWNAIDTTGQSVWNSYLLTPTYGALYTIAYPGIEVQPDLAAAEEVPPPAQEGDVWVAEVPMVEDAQWSDGEPITAEDVAFTWNTANDFGLGGNWIDYVDGVDPENPEALGVVSVEAADEYTVRVSFSGQPGLALWGLGNGAHNIPVQPQHFWGPIVEEAAAGEDPGTTLRSASGEGAPGSGYTVFAERQPGSFARVDANDSYHKQGEEITSGEVTYPDGPFFEDATFQFYGGQDQAVLALADGSVDFLLNPLGMERGLQEQVQDNPDLTSIINPTNGYRFMAFNLLREPMSDSAFRDALAVIIDKEFVTGSILQGVAYPVYAQIPEGNTPWYNEEAAAGFAEAQFAGAETDARRVEAIRILTEAGYTWEVEPLWTTTDADDPAVIIEHPEPVEGSTFRSGQGIMTPDGEPVGQLELIAPTAAYDPLRAAFANYISGVAIELGIQLLAVPTEFNTIVSQVYTVQEDDTMDFDMYILGWSLGNPALPGFHGAFFSNENFTWVNDGNNNMGFDNEEFEAANDAFEAAQSEEEAYEAIWEMEQILATEKPYVLLFDTGILEFYNNRVSYPFTETLSGLQFISGAQGAVQS